MPVPEKLCQFQLIDFGAKQPSCINSHPTIEVFTHQLTIRSRKSYFFLRHLHSTRNICGIIPRRDFIGRPSDSGDQETRSEFGVSKTRLVASRIINYIQFTDSVHRRYFLFRRDLRSGPCR